VGTGIVSLITDSLKINIQRKISLNQNYQKIIKFLLLFALAAYGQTLTSVAVLPSEGTVLGNEELDALTDEMRVAALKVLPTTAFVLLKQDVVVKRLGGAENYIKECKESSCIVNLGKKAQVDYVAQASVSKLGNKIRLKVELCNVRTEGFVGMFNEEAGDVDGLLAIVKKRVPAEVFGKIPDASIGLRASPLISGGISGLEKAGDYELDYGGKRYLANISTEPIGAVLSFNGLPDSRCARTPCKTELNEGNVRIIANLEHYETADTTVSIMQNNQNIFVALKPNFGVLVINPAYIDGIGYYKQWSLSINDEPSSFGEMRLLPNKYVVKLRHECYEDIDFEVGLNKGSHEIFDMDSNIVLKKGGLDLSAEADGEPAIEPVFVNGKQVGETPFISAVPVCAKVEIGENREDVDVAIEHKASKKYIHQMSTEEMKRRARLAEERRIKEKRELEKMMREKAEMERILAERRQMFIERKQKEQAKMRSPRIAFISGGISWLMDYINPLYKSFGAFYYINPEFVSIVEGRLRFGADFDIGMTQINMSSNDDVCWWRGGALARLYFLESLIGPYVTAGAGWYKDWNKYEGHKNIEPYSGTSFSVGAGLWYFVFIEAQYFIMPTDGRLAGYLALRGGFSLPMAILGDL